MIFQSRFSIGESVTFTIGPFRGNRFMVTAIRIEAESDSFSVGYQLRRPYGGRRDANWYHESVLERIEGARMLNVIDSVYAMGVTPRALIIGQDDE